MFVQVIYTGFMKSCIIFYNTSTLIVTYIIILISHQSNAYVLDIGEENNFPPTTKEPAGT